MSHNAELKKAAEGAVNAGSHWGRRDSFERQLAKLATPEAVLALIAENKRLAANVKLNLCDHPAIHQGDVDLLVAFVTGTSQMELAKVHGCTPPNISRKIRRVKERLGWREGMLVSEIRDRAEQLRALASQGAAVTADLMAERDQLRAEVAGLRTGYEASERVNAELKAENEALKKRIDDMSPFKGAPLTGPDLKCLACGGYHYGLQGLPCPNMRITASAALGQGEQS